MNLPIFITIIRLILVPVFAIVFFSGSRYSLLISAAVFITAGLSDILDGYLARKYNLVTKLGVVLDPIADKLMQGTAFICLTIKEYVPIPILLIYLFKELLMGAGTLIFFRKFKDFVAAKWYGKMATFVFYAVVILVMIIPSVVEPYLPALLAVVVLTTLFAFFMYCINVFKYIKKNKMDINV